MRRGEKEGPSRGKGLRGTNSYAQNKLQGYTVQHRKYGLYFIITLDGISFIQILNQYVVHLKLIL